MCGIAGFLGPARADERDVAAALARALAHRGPDGEGAEFLDAGGRRLALVHRRLSIIDLSELGRQPMRDHVSGDWIVYNGELYNFRALRSELEALGETFRSRSDTEILLRGWSRWGLGVLEKAQGMFAFAIWDASERRLVLAVDPLGVKPLYWRDAATFAFASEVRALLDAGLAPRKADAAGLESYLAYGAVQGPGTAIAGVRSLQGGHYVIVTADGRIDGPRRYWRPAFGGPARDKAELPALLDLVAREHLAADVPVAAFLSGGVDSTALAAFACRHAPGLKTFSVTFAESAWSEAPYARAAARHLGLEHTELELSASELCDALPAALASLDQPTLDGTNVFVISRAVRGAGVKVALSGQGGDEIFAGYSTFKLVPRAQSWGRSLALVPAAGRRALAAAWTGARGRQDKWGQFLAAAPDVLHTYLLLRQVFSPSARRALLGRPGSELALPSELEEGLREEARGLDPVNAVSLFELRTYLGQMLLRDGDVMSMAHGLEVRVPYLDRRVVDLVASLPGPSKLERGRPKPLLLDAAAGAVPEEVWRRPKQGFTFPWEQWLRGPLRPLGDEALRDAARLRALGLEPRETGRLWQAFLDGGPGLSWSRIWCLIALREWSARTKVTL